MAKSPDIREWPGWQGIFTREQAPEAKYPNEMRIKKTVHEPGDGTPNGTGGTVLGSVYAPGKGVAYFVEWDNRPRVAVLVAEYKIGIEFPP